MIKRNCSVPTIFKTFSVFFLLTGCALFAQTQNRYKKDSTKNILLAIAAKSEEAAYVTKSANVVYPELLSGCEKQTLDYIENFSVNRRSYLMRMHDKGKKFFPKVTTVLHRHKLPEEFKVLVALESAFNGNAVSKAGAVGYWQIMDEVAQEYGLKYEPQLSAAEKKKLEKELKKAAKNKTSKAVKKSVIKDDRKNFAKSTNVAARYLKDRSRNLDNEPLLVVASYNCGVGNVWEAMKKTGLPNPGFWDVKNYLPAETRNYVMNFIALNVIFKNYDRFINNTLNFKELKIKQEDIDPAAAAVASGALND
jgi:soluble lytic murein transglycosylase-like protein